MSDREQIARAQAQLDGVILPLGTPLQAIAFALLQGVEAQIFLEAWTSGDIREWPEYQEFLNANPSNSFHNPNQGETQKNRFVAHLDVLPEIRKS